MCAEIYYIFVMFMCGVSLVLSILAMYMHNCSSANEASTAMSPWVILLLRRPKVYRLFYLIYLLTVLMKRARNVTLCYCYCCHCLYLQSFLILYC